MLCANIHVIFSTHGKIAHLSKETKIIVKAEIAFLKPLIAKTHTARVTRFSECPVWKITNSCKRRWATQALKQFTFFWSSPGSFILFSRWTTIRPFHTLESPNYKSSFTYILCCAGNRSRLILFLVLTSIKDDTKMQSYGRRSDTTRIAQMLSLCSNKLSLYICTSTPNLGGNCCR